ncbi:MAG: DksA/TraR family C4-type zinc finger protein [Pseudomonadota bacterium]
MAGGWARDGAEQEQIDATVEDAIKRVRSELKDGASATHCEDCSDAIPERRRQAIRGVRRCVRCQEEEDERRSAVSGYNRRGSKDSQLR